MAALAVSRRRLSVLADALGRPTPDAAEVVDADGLRRALAALVDVRDHAEVWLTIATLTASLPEEDDLVEVVRGSEFDDAATLAEHVLAVLARTSRHADVRVVTGAVIVDVAHTASSTLTTGIQRVARETARRWLAEHECLPVSWTEGFHAMRELDAVEHARVVRAEAAAQDGMAAHGTVVVPWRSTYLVPELAAEPARSARLRALARFSGNTTGVIGFDCVPITSAETTQSGFAGVFAGNLSAVRYFDHVATISEAARVEYEGWRSTLPAIGLSGPDVRSIPLPVEVPSVDEDALASARARFVVGALPFVLVVGSHEPRKNHPAVLHAAELLWREGHEFSLSFVGGNAWGSTSFRAQLAEAQRAGRPVDSASKISDAVLWAAYRLARFTVFPSLHEGFGLPVAESLAVGTPAVTSAFGSMQELADDGGALVVDPRDDRAIADAMRALLVDDAVHDRLTAEARSRPSRTWDDYAAETWTYFVEGAATHG